MKPRIQNLLLIAVIVIVLGFAVGEAVPAAAETLVSEATITGALHDKQGEPIEGAEIKLVSGQLPEEITAAAQPNGLFTLVLPKNIALKDAEIHIERSHFEGWSIMLDSADIEIINTGGNIVLPGMEMERSISPAFWIATAVFVGVLALIATGKLHNTLAALLGGTIILGVSYQGHPINEKLFIFDFDRALHYVDWNVVGLIMGMMIVIALVENTGIFQWLALQSYKLSGGKLWVLLPILMLITGVASAFLDNVTTMLLMTPISIQIAIALGINPLALLMPELMASNVAGIATLVGTPTNILIGSYAGISFTDFLVNLTPGVVLALIGLVLYSEFVYRDELKKASSISPVLLQKLEENGRITQPEQLKKAGIIGVLMLLMFIFGEQIELKPAVTALIGATLMLTWIKPDIEKMIGSVDWTTLVFFVGLFVVVGAIQEVGLISVIADMISSAVGDSISLAMGVVLWAAALLSSVVANIPFTAAMLPVIRFLSSTIPGGESMALYYSLSVGSAMGGNGSLIGASANMVTAGIAEKAGYQITYGYFLKKGLPSLVITVGLAMIWLFIRF